jgi:uncharacterized protein YuzE
MTNIWYDDEEDIIGVQVSKKRYWKSIEVAPNVIIDISKTGEITGFEILMAKKSFGRNEMPLIVSAASKRSK